jgi:hypothetical protein
MQLIFPIYNAIDYNFWFITWKVSPETKSIYCVGDIELLKSEADQVEQTDQTRLKTYN